MCPGQTGQGERDAKGWRALGRPGASLPHCGMLKVLAFPYHTTERGQPRFLGKIGVPAVPFVYRPFPLVCGSVPTALVQVSVEVRTYESLVKVGKSILRGSVS